MYPQKYNDGYSGTTISPQYQVTVISSPDDGHRKLLDNEQAFLSEARDRFNLCEEAEAKIRQESLEDLRFRAGEQWPDNIKNVRDADKRPCLTVNRIPQFLKQITNEFRLNPLAVQVSPIDSNSDKDTAEILQGLIRHIELQSNAQVAYDTASEYAATMGFGYFRIVTDFDNPQSFQQEIYIRRIPNPFSVYFDPSCQEPDYSDAQFAFITSDLTPDQFRAEFPNADLASLSDYTSIGDRMPGWFNQDSIRIAEYFCVHKVQKQLVQLADGSVKYSDMLGPWDAPVVKTRMVEAKRVEWTKISGAEILDRRDWPGQWIPIVPVLGDELNIDGERQLIGIVRYARDPQRAYNYWTSAETEMIALAPRVPYIGAEGQFENHEEEWRTSNSRNHAFLQYKPKNINGVLVGPPQRQTFEPPIQAISMARMQAADDLKATTGLYDASLGAVSNEKSGRAILARQKEGDTATFHFSDNRARAVQFAGRILVDLIPHIYNAPRVVRIVGQDDSVELVPINQVFEKVRGVRKIYDLTTGRYDVAVSVGPSYQSKRQEAVESMMQLVSAYPQIAAIAGDLIVRNMDWPGAEEIADRLKKLLPPQLQDDENQPPASPQFIAQYQQLAAQNEALTVALKDASAKIQSKQADLEQTVLTNNSKEKIAALQAQVDLIKVEATLNAQNAQKLMAAEFASINKRLDLLVATESIPPPQPPTTSQT